MSTAADIADRIRGPLGPFASWLTIRTKEKTVIPFGTANWQDEQIQFDRDRTGMDLVLKGRQIGMSTLELARDVKYAVRHKGAGVVVVAHTLSAKRGLQGIVRLMVADCARKRLCHEPDVENVDEIIFSDRQSSIRVIEAGATAVSADDKGRSGTINRLHVTELAYFREPEATLTALRGAMPKDGSAEVVIESTPNGASGLFYKMVTEAIEGRGSYKLHFFPWFDHVKYRSPPPDDFDAEPRDEWEERLRAKGCDDQQIQFWRERVNALDEGGIEGALQEYPIDPLSCFRMMSGAYLTTQLCDFAASHIVQPIAVERCRVQMHLDGVATEKWPWRDLGAVKVYKRHAPGTEAIISADVASGAGGDADSFVIRARERRTGALLASLKSNTLSEGDGGLAMAWLGRRYGTALLAPERNFGGTATLLALTKLRTSVTPYPRIYEAADGKLGWLTSKETRPLMWDDWHSALRAAMESGEARGWFDSDMVEEMRTLVLKNGRPEAAYGAHDDVWCADAIGWQLRQRVARGAPPTNDGMRSESEQLGDLA